MRDSTYRITLDLHDTVSQVYIQAKRNDSARSVRIDLMEDGHPYKLDRDSNASLKVKKPDGTVLMHSVNLYIKGNYIVYQFSPQTTASAGECLCELLITGTGGSVLGSPRFTILVNDVVYDDYEVTSASEYTALEAATIADAAEYFGIDI